MQLSKKCCQDLVDISINKQLTHPNCHFPLFDAIIDKNIEDAHRHSTIYRMGEAASNTVSSMWASFIRTYKSEIESIILKHQPDTELTQGLAERLYSITMQSILKETEWSLLILSIGNLITSNNRSPSNQQMYNANSIAADLVDLYFKHKDEFVLGTEEALFALKFNTDGVLVN